MITSILRGQLGNRMFQYAMGRALALRLGTTLSLDIFTCLRTWNWLNPDATQFPRFNIKARLRKSHVRKIRLLRYPRDQRLGRYVEAVYGPRAIREPAWGFWPELCDLPDGSCIYGYFQSHRYFEDVAAAIRDELTPKAPVGNDEVAAAEQRIEQTNSVAVHVRRGDYLTTPLLNVCTGLYYADAHRLACERLDDPRFFVFSNDLPWCRANLDLPDCEYVDLSTSRDDPTVDLRLMALCRHQIISNSTFSWWAAWLNRHEQKLVVAPHRWFNDEAMNERALRDMIPADWVRVAVQ